VSLASAPGRGSAFSVAVPTEYHPPRLSPSGGVPALAADHG
jgi:hypothetical protein